jgi:hypothetical protein
MVDESKQFLEILKNNPDRVDVMRNYARERRWKLLYERHGTHFGLSYDETKRFGTYLLGSSPEEKPPKSQLEIERKNESLLEITAKGTRVQSLEQLLEASDTDLSEWIVKSHKVNTWEVASRNSDQEMEVTPVWQVKASLEPKRLLGVKPVSPHRIKSRKTPPPRNDNLLRALFVPDTQHGFRWKNKYKFLDPLHDRKAIDAVVQLAHKFQPDVIVLLGDFLDLAEWSTKFPTTPDLRQTTQPTIAELHWQLAQFREACPDARMVYTCGNHDHRAEKMVAERLEPAVDLRFARDPEDADPVLHISRLLALDHLQIDYEGPYDSDWYLWDRIRIHHGNVVRRGGGATVAARLKDASHSEVFGHIHRMELGQKLVRGPHGHKAITAMSPGCLCRVDGTVPGTTKNPDWQQGVGLAYIDISTDTEHLSVLPILAGRVIFEGQVLEGVDRAAEIAEATGYPQIVGEK